MKHAIRCTVGRFLYSVGLSAFALLAPATVAQEFYVLPIAREGTATVAISSDIGRAYITDGGQRGKGGVAGVHLDDKPLLEFLAGKGVRELVITCSHPHADHIGGLRDLVRDPKILEFQRVVFVDSGFTVESDSAAQSLYRTFDDYWTPGQLRRAGSDRPPTEYRCADRANAFGDLSSPVHSVYVSNFVYEPRPGDGHPHGHTVFTEYTISAAGQRFVVVDPDDAEDWLIERWCTAKAVELDSGRLPSGWRIGLLLGPHHGSATSSIEPFLNQTFGPRSIVFTTIPGNRYFHPSPANVLDAMEAIGIDNVHFSGVGKPLVVGPEGVRVRNTRLSRPNTFRQFLDRPVRESLRKLAQQQTRMAVSGDRSRSARSKLKRLESDAEAALRLKKLMLEGASGEIDVEWSGVLESGTGDFRSRAQKLSAELERLNSTIASGGSVAPSPSPMQPLQQSSTSVGTSGGGTRGGGPRASESAAPRRSSPISRTGSTGGARLTRFARSLSIPPVFGGIIIGNRPAEAPGGVCCPRIYVEDGVVCIGLVSDIAETENEYAYCDLTGPELWAAYHFVQPTAEMREEFELDSEECSLVGMQEKFEATGLFSERTIWSFALHPAIANSVTAIDAMQADMLLAESRAPWLAELLAEKEPPRTTTYQWFDEQARISLSDGEVVVDPANEPQTTILRARFWHEKQPAWLTKDDVASIDREIERRFGLAAKAAALDSTTEYLAHVTTLQLSQLTKELLASKVTALDAEARQVLSGWHERAAVMRAAVERATADAAGIAIMRDLASPVRAVEEVLKEASQVTLPSWIKDQGMPAGMAILRRVRGVLAGSRRNGEHDDLPYFRVQAAFEGVVEAMSIGEAPDDIDLVLHRMDAWARANQLDNTNAFRLGRLLWKIRKEVNAELSVEVSTVVPEVSAFCYWRVPALQRLDRFARGVALLNWIKSWNGELPELPTGVEQAGVRVPPLFDSDNLPQ